MSSGKRGAEWCVARDSGIHGQGVYAVRRIPAATRVLEFLGERIDKAESERRALAQQKRAARTGEAAVHIFSLDDEWDLDGNVPWNVARLINHSCEPNCEAWDEEGRIFIHSLRKIAAGEELSIDYGFGIETWEDHPCRCGASSCVGFIVGRDMWDELRGRLACAKYLIP